MALRPLLIRIKQSCTPMDIISAAQCFAPLVVLGVVAWFFQDFVIHAIMGNRILNSGIILIAFSGAMLMLFRLFEAQRERTVLRRFHREASNGGDMKVLLEESWLTRRMMYRYLSPIAETGGKLSSQLDQEAIEGELRALSSEFESRLELPNFLVGFMVAMGLLGTFIGLLETLTGIASMLDGMSGAGNLEEEFVKLIGELRKPLAGMGIAFSASMFGLVSSLMLGVMLLTVRRYVRRVMSEARRVLNALVERVRGPLPMMGAVTGAASTRGGVSEAFLSDFMAELLGNISSLQDLFHRSQDSSLQMTTRVDGLSKRLELVSQSIENNVAASKKTNDLLGFGPRMKETNEEMLSELRSILSANTDMGKVSARLIDVLNSIDQKLGIGNDTHRLFQDAQGNISRDTLTKIDEAVGLLHTVNDRGADNENRLDRRLQALASSSTAIATGVQQLAVKMNEVASISQNQLSNAGTVQQSMRDAVSETLDSFKDLSDRLKKIEEIDVGGSRHLWEIKENFGAMNSALEPLAQIAQGITHQSTILESTLEEMRNSQRNLIRDMQKEFREVSRELARVLAQQQQQQMLQFQEMQAQAVTGQPLSGVAE
ncbi:MAG: MotA/TolQ/ExbB proton channel family protein [Rhodospirillaceae bacterium]|nr:MotA/TolQ/ExbB proton channel family protein [Rhodospirillaceae bacterium]